MSAMSGQREYKIPNQTNKFVEYSDLGEMEGMLRVAFPPSQWRNRDFVGRGSVEVELPFTRTSGLSFCLRKIQLSLSCVDSGY